MFAKPEQFSKISFFQISVLLMIATTTHKESKKTVLIYLSVNSIVQNKASIVKDAYQGFYYCHTRSLFA